VRDDLAHIFKVIGDNAALSKWAGGLGNDWTNIRAANALIRGTNGLSQGVIPFLKIVNDTALAVNQGGKRKGAVCAYLEIWHLEIEDFIELRKNTGDERRRTHDMHTAAWIPDLFMKRVETNGDWTLLSPDEAPDLHDLYGTEFDARYAHYEQLAAQGRLRQHKKLPAVKLWRHLLSHLFETGHPWITFKDPSNIRSAQDHVGRVHGSNLCTEILLNTSADETAVCNLGSINLAQHMGRDGLDMEQLEATVRTAMRMLDNVIDINFYPTPEARRSNLQHRPVGLGIMGFQDALFRLRISYADARAVELADRSMEAISYFAILASTELAKERGTYASYRGSKWDRGLLPVDTIDLLAASRGGQLEVNRTTTLDWQVVRDAVRTHGMRNCQVLAIAPTATISNIAGCTQSIEPQYRNLFTKSNLSGEFTIVNEYLIEDLKTLGLWNADMLDEIKYHDGSIAAIERIPEEIRQLYRTAFEIEPKWIIEAASRRQKWIDMGQSLNLYTDRPSGAALHDMYVLAWCKGLKTTYYLRGQAATQIEKSSLDINRHGIQPRWMKNRSASADVEIDRRRPAADPGSPAACRADDPGCESCQ
jgi:ribonucleoside-diphosphate reductase alpha chain